MEFEEEMRKGENGAASGGLNKGSTDDLQRDAAEGKKGEKKIREKFDAAKVVATKFAEELAYLKTRLNGIETANNRAVMLFFGEKANAMVYEHFVDFVDEAVNGTKF